MAVLGNALQCAEANNVKHYTYDSANRLIQVTDQSIVTNLAYNGLGQRLSMDAAGVRVNGSNGPSAWTTVQFVVP